MFPNKRGLKSKLEKLSKRQQAQLRKWLRERTYKEAISLLEERFGVSATLSQLHSFYHRFCVAEKTAHPDKLLLDVILKQRAKGALQITILEASPRIALHGHKNLKALVRRGRGA